MPKGIPKTLITPSMIEQGQADAEAAMPEPEAASLYRAKIDHLGTGYILRLPDGVVYKVRLDATHTPPRVQCTRCDVAGL